MNALAKHGRDVGRKKHHVFDFVFETSVEEKKALDPELTPDILHLMIGQ